MQVKKAVITAAGERQRRLPLQTLVDRDGVERTVLAILVDEILSAKIEQICVVVRPGDEAAYADAVPEHRSLLRFVPQDEPRGYGDALYRARSFVGEDAFLHLVGDHVYLSTGRGSCAAQLVQVAEAESCAFSAVRATHERLLTSFGVVGGQPVAGRPGLYRVDSVLEKPTPTVAEQRLIVPGMRAGHYLAFFGMHVLTPSVLKIIERLLASSQRATLSDALAELAKHEPYLALQVNAERYDLGATYGLLTSQLALALTGRDRNEVLSMMVGLLASEHIRAKESAAE
jgi:UTP--glucose-1-phosphate uridylyltransferase